MEQVWEQMLEQVMGLVSLYGLVLEWNDLLLSHREMTDCLPLRLLLHIPLHNHQQTPCCIRYQSIHRNYIAAE